MNGQVVRACLGKGGCRWLMSTAWGTRGPAYLQTSLAAVLQVKSIQEYISIKVRHETGPFTLLQLLDDVVLLPIREVIVQEDGCVLGHGDGK